MDMEGEILTLTDETGHLLNCYVEAAVDLDGERYALLSPVDYPVDIFAWVENGDEEEILMPIEEAELSEIFATAQAVLAEQNLKLKRSALSLTVEGELPEVDEEQILAIEAEDFNENDEQDEYQLLATFFHEEQEYAAYTPIDPVLFIVRLNEHNEPELLKPEEFKLLQPKLLPYFEEHLLDDEA
ncbi:DUF3727 domain-containing protein [Lyngbya confervoides]|uniref:DUF3727 domain-containing protein n=1 Tax=Lyngbya confervoides BDU141951 TaxID=1574623 RepID=A0ABD4SYA7_9CYAN|nr:DUF3727 domain-containing protein [Lyngbya confervoides]MCM1981363.1 DUF3727 domain-containing protein [Lyngbya confervoides BDU141951]